MLDRLCELVTWENLGKILNHSLDDKVKYHLMYVKFHYAGLPYLSNLVKNIYSITSTKSLAQKEPNVKLKLKQNSVTEF